MPGDHGRWLAERRIAQFGEPLDHGEETGAPGVEAEAGPESTAARRELEGIDQGQERAQEAGPRGGPGTAPAPGATTVPRPLTDPRPSGRPAVVGGLRAVTDRTAGEVLGHGARRQIAQWQRPGATGTRWWLGSPDSCSARRSSSGCRTISCASWRCRSSFAVRGRVAPGTPALAIARLSKRHDRGEAAKALGAWLVEKANERELLGQRKAA